MNKKYILIAVIFLGIFIRFAYVISVGSKAPEGDAAGYDIVAYNLAEHGEFTSRLGVPYYRRTPSFPCFLAAIYTIFGRSYLIVSIVQSFLGIITCFLVYFIGKIIADKNTAAISFFISLFYPFFIYYTGVLLIEAFFVFLIVLSLYLFLMAKNNPSFKYIILTALTSAASYLCKPVVMPYILISILFLTYIWGLKKPMSYVKTSVFLIIFALPLLLWGARNYRVIGHFAISHPGAGRELLGSSYSYDIKIKGQAFRDMIATTDDPIWAQGRELNEFDRDKYYLNEGIKFAKNNPWQFFNASVKKFIKFWRLYPTVEYIEGSQTKKTFLVVVSLLSYGIILPFSLYGIYLSLKKWKDYFFFYNLILTFSAIHMLLWAQIRYRLPLMPSMIIFASLSLNQLYKKIKLKTAE